MRAPIGTWGLAAGRPASSGRRSLEAPATPGPALYSATAYIPRKEKRETKKKKNIYFFHKPLRNRINDDRGNRIDYL